MKTTNPTVIFKADDKQAALFSTCDTGLRRLSNARAVLGLAILKARGDRTLTEVADLLDYPEDKLTMVEQGTWLPSTMTLLRWGVILDLDLNVVARAAFGDFEQ